MRNFGSVVSSPKRLARRCLLISFRNSASDPGSLTDSASMFGWAVLIQPTIRRWSGGSSSSVTLIR